jgi:hypothetical protein
VVDTVFSIYAGVMKFTAALLKDQRETTMPADEDTANDEPTAPGRASARSKERNAHAVACLSMALTTEDDMVLVLHEQLGHMNEDDARKTAKALDIVITCGTLNRVWLVQKPRRSRKDFQKTTTHMKWPWEARGESF